MVQESTNTPGPGTRRKVIFLIAWWSTLLGGSVYLLSSIKHGDVLGICIGFGLVALACGLGATRRTSK